MAKLRDLVDVNINDNYITIQGVNFRVLFTMRSFEYIAEAYGKGYKVFEKDMHKLIKKGQFTASEHELKIMRSLIYAMVRTGGTECDFDELEGAIPITELKDIYITVMNIFSQQTFQVEDNERIKQPKK
ncbi:hypothetical protein AWI85_05970 [Listeria monocytogenes]|uniref:hypothetical protein n=1 Tax=Listeria monocytogenes TaxID=1639 RepID=UPI000775C9D4|nr:hypothetical protein [Listeria monocytogenes]EAD0080281.1 hypothetical protein [Listeria monocytogenes]EAE0845967.1 hypothetical protein [Listeria monocytogenes]EAF8771732.1 hypothetical protein [Listeria monocytogenes]EEA6131061.1 hypothetical protein [Listeria monocytogenes]EKZ1452128.1 hypothetical protein [Listeria monocytogenes]